MSPREAVITWAGVCTPVSPLTHWSTDWTSVDKHWPTEKNRIKKIEMGKLAYSQFGLELRKQLFSVFSLCFFSTPELKLTEGEKKAGREARGLQSVSARRKAHGLSQQNWAWRFVQVPGLSSTVGRWSSKEKIKKKTKNQIISP